MKSTRPTALYFDLTRYATAVLIRVLFSLHGVSADLSLFEHAGSHKEVVQILAPDICHQPHQRDKGHILLYFLLLFEYAGDVMMSRMGYLVSEHAGEFVVARDHL